MKAFLFTITISLLSQLCYAQLGGARGFEFINVPSDTRMAAMGGVNVSLSDWDVNMLYQNPASVNAAMNGHLSVQHAFYYAGINISRLTYAHHFEKSGTWAWGLQNINYGRIEGFDLVGDPTGEYQANETILITGNSRQTGNFRLGLSAKMAYSGITGYNAFAIMFDVGGMFIHPEADFRAGMNIRNIGIVISDYTTTSGSKIPFDVQAGTSFKPEYMPVRVSITAYNLYRADVLYNDPAGALVAEEPTTLNRIFSHLNFGAEVIINDNFNLRAGYNYLIRWELRLENTSGGAGFSYGLMFRVKAFEFSYSRAIYHVSGGINYIGITSNLNRLYKKVRIKENNL